MKEFFSIKNLFWTAIQLIVVFGFLLIFSLISRFTGLKDAQFLSVWTDLLQEIDLFNSWVGVLMKYKIPDPTEFLTVFFDNFFQSVITALLIKLAKFISKKLLRIKGTPILPVFFAIFISAIIMKAGSVNQIFAVVLYIVIILVGIFFMLKGISKFSLGLMSVRKLLILIVESLLAAMLSGFMVALTMFGQKQISATTLWIMTILAIISLLCTYLVTDFEKDLKKTQKILNRN